ncbi:hypothetical protein DPMN_167530 [Dreissena polymorpha]|uniref:Uncharacterized protein n=1 Tax=Dreissena polymorpha TaxID=45954 RepID=A0A9D4F0H4_DREPO|nr:hypothetical protein DPMN_167530 [Dreissena polymorpha]
MISWRRDLIEDIGILGLSWGEIEAHDRRRWRTVLAGYALIGFKGRRRRRSVDQKDFPVKHVHNGVFVKDRLKEFQSKGLTSHSKQHKHMPHKFCSSRAVYQACSLPLTQLSLG